MTTKTESIIAAISAALTGAGVTVMTDISDPESFTTTPAVVIDCGNEAPEGVYGQGFAYWNLTVTLRIIAEGATPKLAPEPTRQAAHTALYADRTLGGLAIDMVVGRVSRSIDEENPAAGITEVDYEIKYRALENAL